MEILVAGCGTGRQVASLSSVLPLARILAIDLSLPSLSYARRKLDELGATSVRLAQGDILELGGFTGQYSYIECAGVLHHLAVPIDGLRVLASLLAPHGVMFLALYSRPAREYFGVLNAQHWVQEQGIPPSADGIRRFRAEVASWLSPEIAARMQSLRDFYYLSQCRDLVFHEMEHCYTVPEIASLCFDAGLDFLGFDEPAPGVFDTYSNRFPNDVKRTDLRCWAQFETEFPGTFIKMYSFYVRRLV